MFCYGQQYRNDWVTILRQFLHLFRGLDSIVDQENWVRNEERKFAKLIGFKEAVFFGSGGTAIFFGLRSCPIPPKSRIGVHSEVCSAVYQSIAAAGFTVVPLRINHETGLICLESLEAVAPSLKALMIVHHSGLNEDVRGIESVCRKSKILLIEDACLALGSKPQGFRLGSFSEFVAVSFGFAKPVSIGEMGAILTDDKTKASELRRVRNWGGKDFYFDFDNPQTFFLNGRFVSTPLIGLNTKIKNYFKNLRIVRNRIQWCKDKYINGKITFVGEIAEESFHYLTFRLKEPLKESKIGAIRRIEEKMFIHGRPGFPSVFKVSSTNSLNDGLIINNFIDSRNVKEDYFSLQFKWFRSTLFFFLFAIPFFNRQCRD